MFLHQTTTSDFMRWNSSTLFIILFLHQTTTICASIPLTLCCLSSCSYIKPQPSDFMRWNSSTLFIILFLHQTTTICASIPLTLCCLSSCSYIKPQLVDERRSAVEVVYHLVPTSNHNPRRALPRSSFVVYHLVPTSNHNRDRRRHPSVVVVYHLVPTSNHNTALVNLTRRQLFIILFLHQTTTD